MGRRSQYASELRDLGHQELVGYLTANSGLPGPRGNIELAQAVADVGDADCFETLLATGEEYLVFCATVGLGRLLAAEHDQRLVDRLRGYAADRRWRVREGVAMALQRLGDADPLRLVDLATAWAADGDPLVQRAAVAGICEPRLLRGRVATTAVDLCAAVTTTLAARPADQRSLPEVRTLRQALGYCWSVAVAGDPGYGLPVFAALDAHPDRDVAWIVRQNRGKQRLARLLSDG